MGEQHRQIQEKEAPPTQIAWLGPVGTFTEKAAKEWLRKMKEGTTALATNHSPSIASIFRDVIEGKYNMGVIPIENTIGGPVKDTHRALEESDGVKIIGEVVLPIKLYFYYQKGAQIVIIASKDQAFSQTYKWRKINHPTASELEVDSTSLAVQMAARDPSIGAIAGEDAAKDLGLQDVLERTQDSVENNKTNATTFVAIAKTSELSEPTGNDKTTFILEIPNQAGKLYSVLANLSERRINLTKIKSLRDVGGKVRFLVSIDGHQKEERVSSALALLLDREVKIKMLGSYPKDNYVPTHTVETDIENAIQMIKKEAQNGDVNNKNNSIVVFTLPNEVGSLAKALKVFAERNIDLTKIDSLPSGNFGEYIFYLAYNREAVVDQDLLMQELSSHCTNLVLLNS